MFYKIELMPKTCFLSTEIASIDRLKMFFENKAKCAQMYPLFSIVHVIYYVSHHLNEAVAKDL